MTHMFPNLNHFDPAEDDIARELAHEEDMIAEGIARQRARLDAEKQRGNRASTAGGRAVLSGMSRAVADRIVEEIARLESGEVKRKPPEVRSLKLLPPKDLAVVAVRAVLNTLAQGKDASAQRLGFAIGDDVEGERIARDFRANDRGLFDRVLRRVNERSANPEQRKKELLKAYERIQSEEVSSIMTRTEKVRLGSAVLMMIEAEGIVEPRSWMEKGRRKKTYEMSETALMLMLKADDWQAEMAPSMYPTIIQPRPWTTLASGGYWLPRTRGSHMVVARTKTNGIRRATEEDMPRMFGPVNYLQATPSRVNRQLLSVVEQMRAANITCASLPPAELEPIPAKPHDIDTNEEARAAWRIAAREVHTRNATAKSRILAAEKTVRIASALADEPRIYFPKVVDFRGRVYDLPTFLKPQGDDLSKGLLEFAHGKPLGEEGAYWLAVHGANVWGEDKVPLDDRVGWVEANEGRICRTAEEPFADRWWMDADKPFQFLAFCFEWAGYCREGFDYVSHLPVALDGSCNGLQHLSAMLRDSVGGAAVNLVPADRPQDIYTEVLKLVVEELEQRAGLGEPTAQKWLPLMKRKTVKRPVMTLPYGATKQGFADQIMEDTIRPLEAAGESPFTTDPYGAAKYLGQIVWEATGNTVIAARAAMDWLQAVAKIVAGEGKAIQWTAPSGFVVRQDYRRSKTKQVELLSAGQRVRLVIADGHEDKIDKGKMALAIAPNFVHAMDAAHMLRTIELLLDLIGPSVHLSMVHDSYATHAADAEVLSVAIRQAFVQLYQEKDWLQAFKEEVAEQLSPEAASQLPPVPPHGRLNVEEVLNSLYFFA